jgi:hypothetical protein
LVIHVDCSTVLGQHPPAGLCDRDGNMAMAEVDSGDFAPGRGWDEHRRRTATTEAGLHPVFGDQPFCQQILHAFGDCAAR